MSLVRLWCLAVFLCITSFQSSSAAQAIKIHVDLTDAPRNIYHSHLTIRVHPGTLSFVFPKWIPGNHRPSGPVGALTGIRMEAAGKLIPWERDALDMYQFQVSVPDGANILDVYLDAITTQDSAGGGGPAASSNILDLNWNAVVLYPKDMRSDEVTVHPSVKLPDGWKFGTALETENASGDEVDFKPVPLTTLVDSPLVAGENFRKVELTKASDGPIHVMDLVADAQPDLQMSAKDEAAYKKLVAETGALFGARHYRHYDFLLTLSGLVGGHGLEHHESNDSVAAERTFSDPDLHLLFAGLVPHEFVHSWNGKYRRPAGLATPNYQEPMIGDLLWVYEGLTEYMGNVLAARSGFVTDEQYRESLAATAATLDHRSGRTWRSLEDTARSVQTLRTMGAQWQNWRRGLDYYPEGELIWLEVDAIIRQQTHEQRSLNDFCRRFEGGESGPPKVVPYTFDDVVRVLNDVAPYDWARLLTERVNNVSVHAPLGGIERGGWKLIYNDQPNALILAGEKSFKGTDFSYSLGFAINPDGKLEDVEVGSPAYTAGIGPGMKLIAVNGRKWSPEVLHAAIRTAKETHQPIDLLVENAQFFKTHSVQYFDGERNPHLERVPGAANVLDQILKPMTP